ncbi:MAG: hypothetical protein WDN26_12405 [Chitinophagaceae bacterium]
MSKGTQTENPKNINDFLDRKEARYVTIVRSAFRLSITSKDHIVYTKDVEKMLKEVYNIEVPNDEIEDAMNILHLSGGAAKFTKKQETQFYFIESKDNHPD